MSLIARLNASLERTVPDWSTPLSGERWEVSPAPVPPIVRLLGRGLMALGLTVVMVQTGTQAYQHYDLKRAADKVTNQLQAIAPLEILPPSYSRPVIVNVAQLCYTAGVACFKDFARQDGHLIGMPKTYDIMRDIDMAIDHTPTQSIEAQKETLNALSKYLGETPDRFRLVGLEN